MKGGLTEPHVLATVATMNFIVPEKPMAGAERELRLLSYVERWQIVQVNRRQNLAEHQYHVAILAWRMVEDCDLRSAFGINMEDVFRESLLHDLPETLSGDIPSPVHQRVKQDPGWRGWLAARVREFFPWYEERPCVIVKHVVSICDLLEALLYLSEEMQMGNRYVEPHYAYLKDRMDDLLLTLPGSGDIARWVRATLERATKPAKVLLNP